MQIPVSSMLTLNFPELFQLLFNGEVMFNVGAVMSYLIEKFDVAEL